MKYQCSFPPDTQPRQDLKYSKTPCYLHPALLLLLQRSQSVCTCLKSSCMSANRSLRDHIKCLWSHFDNCRCSVFWLRVSRDSDASLSISKVSDTSLLTPGLLWSRHQEGGRWVCLLPPWPQKQSSFNWAPASRAADSVRRPPNFEHLSFFSSLPLVIKRESPNEVSELIKQAFNLFVFAQELPLLLASCSSGLQSWI